MAKSNLDRTTLDLFAARQQPGRPKSSPYSREQQLRINKKNQLMRDRQAGLKRVEIKLPQALYDKASDLAEQKGTNRSELLVSIINEYFDKQEG